MKIPAEYSTIYGQNGCIAGVKEGQSPSTQLKTPPFQAESFSGPLITHPAELPPTEVSVWNRVGFNPKTPMSSRSDAY
jgi:hypothetical protein